MAQDVSTTRREIVHVDAGYYDGQRRGAADRADRRTQETLNDA
jgi:hypothetical protein